MNRFSSALLPIQTLFRVDAQDIPTKDQCSILCNLRGIGYS